MAFNFDFSQHLFEFISCFCIPKLALSRKLVIRILFEECLFLQTLNLDDCSTSLFEYRKLKHIILQINVIRYIHPEQAVFPSWHSSWLLRKTTKISASRVIHCATTKCWQMAKDAVAFLGLCQSIPSDAEI